MAVLLLADVSRSTANMVPGTERSVLDIEKEAIVVLCEALSILGDGFAAAGFSGRGRQAVEYLRIKDFGEPLSRAVRSRIGALQPQRNTRMGAAIRHAARQLTAAPARVRLLIILSDGFPNDTGYKGAYGQAVVIDHGNRLSTLYGHASRLLVRVGDVVMPQQEIALVGSTGRSSGPHLHFEVIRDGRRVDPGPYLAEVLPGAAR